MRIPEVKASVPTPANSFYARENDMLSCCMLFAHLRLRKRPSRDGQCALWDCFNLGTHFQHGGKFVPQNSPIMHFDNHLAGPVRNLKVANTQLANSPWHWWKEWRVLISVNLLSFFLVKVMPQSQKGRKIEHVSGERNVAKFNSWWGKEKAVLIFLIIIFSKLATLLLLNMTLPKKKLNFNWRPSQGGTSSKLQECERGTTFQ